MKQAADDYVALLEHVHARADYVAVNISSPNTPGLRALQARDAIEPLLKKIADARAELSSHVPLLVKIAPDLSFDEIDGAVDAARDAGFDGVIATNTTISRDGAPEYTQQWGGGMSGKPLQARATEVIRHIHAHTTGEFPIIGVGGISDAGAARWKNYAAGATSNSIVYGVGL